MKNHLEAAEGHIAAAEAALEAGDRKAAADANERGAEELAAAQDRFKGYKLATKVRMYDNVVGLMKRRVAVARALAA